jgi:glutamate racemase
LAAREVEHRPIGVFDSGVGGLSVLQALQAELPHERFVYVGDQGHAPYGERDDAHVLARSRTITDYLLLHHGIKALVVACNTATAAAIWHLRAAYPALPMVGVEPALKPAATQTRTGVVAVMATRGTLQSDKFKGLLSGLAGTTQFRLQACDGLADAIERNDVERIQALCVTYTQALGPFGTADGQADVLVLGCTHYPWIDPLLESLVGAAIPRIDAGAPVAKQTRRVLQDHGLSASTDTHASPLFTPLASKSVGVHDASPATMTTCASTLFCSTGDPSALQNAVKRWLHCNVEVTPISD